MFCQTFTAGLPGLGEPTEVALCPGGEALMVTEDNRRQFVDAYVNCVLSTAVHRQFEARINRVLPLSISFMVALTTEHLLRDESLPLALACCNSPQ